MKGAGAGIPTEAHGSRGHLGMFSTLHASFQTEGPPHISELGILFGALTIIDKLQITRHVFYVYVCNVHIYVFFIHKNILQMWAGSWCQVALLPVEKVSEKRCLPPKAAPTSCRCSELVPSM